MPRDKMRYPTSSKTLLDKLQNGRWSYLPELEEVFSERTFSAILLWEPLRLSRIAVASCCSASGTSAVPCFRYGTMCGKQPYARHSWTRASPRFAEMGYDAKWCVLGAGYLGYPIKRDRLWILGKHQSHNGRLDDAGSQ